MGRKSRISVQMLLYLQGMLRFDAREAVAQKLQRAGLWRGQTEHSMTVPICSRSSDIIEPRIKNQWYIDCSQMAERAIKVEKMGPR